MLDTAISSPLVAEVTAKKIRTRMAAAPVEPRSAAAAYGAARPALISWGERGRMPGVPLSATAENPIVVAKA